VDEGEPAPGHLARARRALGRVVGAAVLVAVAAACGSEGDALVGTTATTDGPSPFPTTTTTAFVLSPDRGSAPADTVTFRPVLAEPSVHGPPPYPSLDQLGPTALDGRALVGASSSSSPANGQWVVQIVFAEGPTGIGAFNAIAGQCYERGPECPTGLLAIVVDGVVVSAPSIQSPHFEAEQVQISGDFDGGAAEQLADRLTAAAHG
jgi:preprotein translocase subunit SecD